MTSSYLSDITPDSFSGLIFAFEGIRNSITLINGPTGCKFYHSAIADNQMLRQTEFDPLNYSELWFFGQPRVPATYLDTRDYVYGSREKLSEALVYLRDHHSFDVMAVINSPGAALIGDDIEAMVHECIPGKPVVAVESPGFSRTVWEGYDDACRDLVELIEDKIYERGIGSRTEDAPGRFRVNLLGMSITQKYYEGDLAELKRVLGLCDIDVNCALCCDCTFEEILDLGHADLNVVVDATYGLGTAKRLEEMFGIPYVASQGIPVGYLGMEELMSSICDRLGADISAYREDDERARARTYIHLSRMNSLTGRPKGVPFAVHGTSSQCLGYCRFLMRYFALAADSVAVLNPDEYDPEYRALPELLSQRGMSGALEKDILDTDAQLVFADANIIAKLKLRHLDFSGIEIALPTMGYTDVIPKTHLGTAGGMMLVEQVINGLMY